MSEGSTTMVSMNELEKEIESARKALELSIEFENATGFDIDATMDRKYNEGFLEAIEFIYILQNGHEYSE